MSDSFCELEQFQRIDRSKTFDFNKDKNKIYCEEDFNYYEPVNLNKVSRKIYKQWQYGETVVIKFDLKDTYDELINAPYVYYVDPDAEKYLEVTLMNYRYEPIKTYNLELSQLIGVKIDYNLSINCFKKGLYYAQVRVVTMSDKRIVDLLDSEGETYTTIEILPEAEVIESKILIDAKDCVLQVI